MYQRARKLHDLSGDSSLILPLAEEQLEAYLIAINALTLLDRNSAWVVLPIAKDVGTEVSIAPFT